ncbi:hypothetical protein ACMAZF_09270 [Psychrobium sp. nBUS_13]|uniref:hypothetical protein n=1 Tax=Psychrobium sp. nBUS_13 TaxID=3395319 RepID=UPI003EBF9E07
MTKYQWVVGFTFISTLVVAEEVFTSIKSVDKYCQEHSADVLDEQGLKTLKWNSEFFNGERTFNIDGRWVTNGGTYLVECEAPFGGNESTMTLEISKEKAL